MAVVTLTYNCIGTAYADKQNPNVPSTPKASYEMTYSGSGSDTTHLGKLFLKFERFPDNLRRQKIIDAVITDYYVAQLPPVGSNYYTLVYVHAVDDFDEATLTYANQPQWRRRLGGSRVTNREPATMTWTPNPIRLPSNITGPEDADAAAILRDSCISIEISQALYILSKLFLNGRLASDKPRMVLRYDDAVTVKYKPVSYTYTSGWLNRTLDRKFSWTIQKDDTAYCVQAPVQVSAEFYWRLGTSGAYNVIPVPDNAKELVIPAGTFPGGTIQWYIKSVSDFGEDLISDTYSFSTLVGDLEAEPSSPINGAFADPLGGTTFMWSVKNEHQILIQTGADLQWSSDGTTWNSLGHVDGPEQSFESPAGVFSAGTYYWRVRAYNADGDVGPWSVPATLSTIDSTMYAVPRHPISEIVETNAEAVFSWGYTSDTGTTPTRTDLQYSRNGAEWTDLATVGSGVLTYTTPAGFFLAGTVYWRARVYNHNDVAGPWCDSVSFISFGAPEMPSVSVDAVPFATLRWQVAGQDAYRIEIDGKSYGPYFGSDKSWTVPEPLEDGRHAAKVYIQGAYALWSQPGEIVFEISNIPGSPVILSGSFDRDAALRWTCEDATADFLIYRDDVQIGHTSGYSFTDRTVLGYHTWRVINRLPGGYYTASNTVSGTLCTEGLALALLSGGPWLDLTLSTNAIRTTTAAAGRSVVLRQFAGREYPDAEAAPYKTLQISFDVSFLPAQADQARAFEALIGEAVIFKEPGEEAFVGVLSAFQRSHSCPARSYSATVQRIHWREYVDADS